MRIQLSLTKVPARIHVAKAASTLDTQAESVTIDGAADEKLMLLARALARQSARRHSSRGFSILKVSLVLALVVLALACLMYGGFLPAAKNLHGPG